MILWELFLSFLQIGALSFGGGYAALPLIQNQAVDIHHWLSLSEFTDLITISQMTPGPIAINAATFVGTRIAGLPGALTATLGCILPSVIIVTILYRLYLRFSDLKAMQTVMSILRPAVVALIASAGLNILFSALGIPGEFSIWMAVLFAASFLLLRYAKLDPILVMILAGIAEVVFHLAF